LHWGSLGLGGYNAYLEDFDKLYDHVLEEDIVRRIGPSLIIRFNKIK